jgi:hypothetical protein
MEFETSSVSALKSAAEFRHDPYILHKESHDDVLLSYCRGALPARIRANALSVLEPAAADFVLAHYKRRSDLQSSNTAERDAYYYNTSVPALITKQEVKDGLLDEGSQQILSNCYRKTDDGFLLCADYLSEIDEMQLLRKLRRTQQWIHESDRCRLSGIIESAGILENNPKILYATVYNDLNNYFFYRKHHEHVPGMMTIEAARQAMYAHAYRYSGLKRGDVSISMKSLSIEFQAYTNANYPVRVVMDDGPNTKPQKWLHKRAQFFQMGQLLAKFEFTGPPIPMENFKKKRHVPVDPGHRFQPVKNILRTLCLTAADGRKYECELSTLAAHSIQVTFKPCTPVQSGDVFSIVLYAKHVGYLYAQTRVGEIRPMSSGVGVELIFLDLTDEAAFKLSEMIKNFTHVVPTDEMF